MAEPHATDVSIDTGRGDTSVNEILDLFGVPCPTDSGPVWQKAGEGQGIQTALETATARMREVHEGWHAEMDALVRAALAFATTSGQMDETVASVAAPASAEAAAERMEAAAHRMEAAVKAASALRLMDVLDVAANSSVDAQALSTLPPPLAAVSSKFETTPAAAAAANPANEGSTRGQACAYCHELGPFFEGVFGGFVCGVHHALTLSLLHDPSNDETSGHGEAIRPWEATAEMGAKEETGGSECTLECGNMVTDGRSGSWCTSGHALCADCTSQYVGKTLPAQGTVWWDTIDCVATGCTKHMKGMSVQRCLSRAVVEHVDAAQLKVVPEIGPEAKRERERAAEAARRELDHASEEAIASSTMPCPQCGAPSVLDTGCNHVRCTAGWCKHEYCFSCGQNWRGHSTAHCTAR